MKNKGFLNISEFQLNKTLLERPQADQDRQREQINTNLKLKQMKMETLNKEFTELKKELGREQMTSPKKIIKHAQKATGLTSVNPLILLKELKRLNVIRERRKRQEKAHLFFFKSLKELSEAEAKAKEFLKDFCTGYSFGDLKQLFLIDKNGKQSLFFEADERLENHKPAFTGNIVFVLSKRELNAMQKISGKWTITRPRTLKAYYFETEGEKGYYKIHLRDGYCVEGQHAPNEHELKKLIENTLNERNFELEKN